MIHVRTLEKTAKGLRAFMDLPYRLYRKDNNWIPPVYEALSSSLLGDHNPLMEEDHQFFLAYDDSRPVARMLAGVDKRVNDRLGEKRGYISLFETEGNMEYARAVLDAAMEYLHGLGMEKVVGPNAPGYNDFSKGLLFEGYDGEPVLFNPYNPSFYNDFFVEYGFQKHRDHFAYHMLMVDFPLVECRKLAEMAEKRFKFRVESVDLRRVDHDELARQITQVVGEAFPADWELVPPTIDDIRDEMQGLINYTQPGLIAMAYAGDRPIGMIAVFPDYNWLLKANQGRLFPFGWLTMLLRRRSVRLARCSMLFVSPDYQNKGVSVALALSAYQSAVKAGIQEVEASTIDETNLPSILNTELLGARRYRVYRQYEKKL